MKNLLSMLAVSTLVGTSASNLKPVFTSNVVNHGFKSNQINQKDLIITNENDTNPFINRIIDIDINERITCNIVTNNGVIYVGTATGEGSLSTSKLYQSTDGIKFIEIKSWNQDYGKSDTIESLAIDNENNIYVGTFNNIFKSIIGADHFFALTGVKGIVESLAVANNNTVYASTSYGLYKSTDGTSFSNDDIQGNVKKIQNKIVTIASNGTIWVGTHDGLWKSTDGTNFENLSSLKTNSIWNIAIAPNGTIWVGTTKGLYKSTDGTSFSNDDIQGNVKKIQILNIAMTNDNNIYIGTIAGLYKSNNGTDFELVDIKTGTSNEIRSLAIINNTIYVGTYNKGLYAINLIEQLIKINKPDTFDKSWPLYNGIVYNSAQKIDIKDNLVASAILDTHSITVPTIDLDIPIGEHNLILTLKDKSLASVFGGDTSTGKVTYKLWVKTAIDKNKIDYQTKIDDTQLYTGLVSNAGNTNNADIIQTKIKNGTGTHDASLNIDFKDILIDFDVNKSFYAQGTIDETTNNFTATGSKQKINKNLSIKTDGIYHLHLEDTVGNTYDSYLELGESNWKLKGTFDDSELDKLKTKLNVTVNLTDPSQKSKAMGWLHQYENFVENKFNETIKTNGKGFDSEIKQQITSYTAFLNPLTYDIANEPKFDDGLDKNALVKTINDKANEILNKGLDALPKNLNINSSNVVNKSTLEHYTNWITNYQDFINKNKDKWINDIEKIASRGFATTEQENQIKEKINKLLNNNNIRNYLKSVVWEDNKLLKATSNDYKQYIELDKLQTDTINWVNANMKDINIAYQQAIKKAESGLNLHGYSIDQILNGKSKPQTKNEIANFADGKSYHDWLQSESNIKFHGWQLKIGLPIAIISLVIIVVAGIFIRRRTNPKYNPFRWERKKEKQHSKLSKSINSNKNKKRKNNDK